MSIEIINEETEEVIIKTELSSDDDTYGDSDLFTINGSVAKFFNQDLLV